MGAIALEGWVQPSRSGGAWCLGGGGGDTNGLHLLGSAGSCIALAGAEHPTWPQVDIVHTSGRNRAAFSDSSPGLVVQTVSI